MTLTDPAEAITVRHPSFDLEDLPRHWVGGSRLGTWFGDAGHVFIPLGEDFFVDTVKAFRHHVTDPAQRRDVNAFVGQELTHRRAHARLWDVLRRQGVPVDRYAELIGQVRRLEDRLPARFRLSVTAALEHYTAAFGHAFLTEDLGAAVPEEMAQLLAWHGLEELEHRAVAYDVLCLVDDRYVLRVAGFAFATGLLLVVPGLGVALFAAAELAGAAPEVGPDPWSDDDRRADARRELRTMTARFTATMARHLVDYLRPGFHPRQLRPPAEAATWATRLAR